MRDPLFLALVLTLATWSCYPALFLEGKGNLGLRECLIFFLLYYGLIQGIAYLCRRCRPAPDVTSADCP